MSILTVDDIAKCWIGIKDPVGMVSKFDGGEHIKEFAARIEQAVIARLATVSVEPVAFHAQDGIVSVASHIDKDKFLFTTEALAAARVQGIEEAAKVAEGYPKYGDATAAEIRALIT